MSKGRFVSPVEMQTAAAEMMTINDPPKTRREQLIAVNFFCVNTTCVEAVQLMTTIFDYAVNRSEVQYIWDKQRASAQEENGDHSD